MTGSALARLRRRLWLTQSQFANVLGVHANSVARMERNEMPISRPVERLALLVAHLHETGDDYAYDLAHVDRKEGSR